LTSPRRNSFWEQAALRAQGESARATSAKDEPVERKPLRREAPPPPPTLPDVTDDELRLRLAEELDYARRMLDAMGDDLSNDAAVVVRHATALQGVDIVGQMLGHIASVIRCSDPEAAVERIGMCELKARLKRRSSF
jgi:hypothetical protein